MDNEALRSKERRKYRRFNYSSPVRFCEMNLYHELGLPCGQITSAFGRLRNISATGLLIEADASFPPESLLKLEIFIPNWMEYEHTNLNHDHSYPCKPLVAVGKVLRRKNTDGPKWEMGIDFIAIDEKHKKAINRFVAAGHRAN